MKKIKVLHIIKSLGRGGAEMLLPATVHQHNKEQFEFHCIYFLPWKNQMVAALQQEGVHVSCFAAKNTLQMLLQIPALTRYIRTHSIDLVHAHLPWAGIVAARAGARAKVPVVYTEHNNVNRYHKITRWLNRFSYAGFKEVIAVSDDAGKAAVAQFTKSPTTIRRIHNGVDTHFFSNTEAFKKESKLQFGITADTLVVSNVAVFRTQKRLDRWLQIVKQLKAHGLSVRFLLIGDGPLKAEVQQLIAEYDLQELVLLPGLQQEMKPWFAATDVFLMSSDWEGLPVALLEAMSMGCVPVVTDAGGIPEVVTDACGVVYAREDVERAVAAIVSLYHDRRALQAYSINTRKRIEEEFSLKKMVAELEGVYERIVGT